LIVAQPKTGKSMLLKDMCQVTRAGGTPSSDNSFYYDGEIPFVTIEDITSSRKYLTLTKKNLTNLGLKSSSAWLVPKGCVLYSMYATVGKVRINKIPVSTNQAILAIKPNELIIDTEYLYYFLCSIEKNVLSETSQTTQANLNAEKVRNFAIHFPSDIKEQRRIVDFLTSSDLDIEAEIDALEKLKLQKQGLMQDLLTGRVRVN
jgi:type I restriction enzyme S subunit